MLRLECWPPLHNMISKTVYTQRLCSQALIQVKDTDSPQQYKLWDSLIYLERDSVNYRII